MNHLCCILLLLNIALKGYDAVEECCQSKTVGGVHYELRVNASEAVPDRCFSKCIYEAPTIPGTRFCFARGNLPVECVKQNTFVQVVNDITVSITGTITFLQNNLVCNLPDFTFNLAKGPGTFFNQFKGLCVVERVGAAPVNPVIKPCAPYIRTTINIFNAFRVIGNGFPSLDPKFRCFVQPIA